MLRDETGREMDAVAIGIVVARIVARLVEDEDARADDDGAEDGVGDEAAHLAIPAVFDAAGFHRSASGPVSFASNQAELALDAGLTRVGSAPDHASTAEKVEGRSAARPPTGSTRGERRSFAMRQGSAGETDFEVRPVSVWN